MHKSYTVGDQEVEILHGVSLNVDAGEIVAVVGPSGSGKPTLMYCLAGLEAPSSGSVPLAGQPLERLSRADLARMRHSEVGFVFQQYNLVPTLTAMENVGCPTSWVRGAAPRESSSRPS